MARGVGALHEREMALKAMLIERFRKIPGVRLRSPEASDGVAIVTITSERLAPGALAARLEAEHGVLTRAGLHCAPEAHQILGTLETGAVRFSPGWATTNEDIERAAEGVAALTGEG